MMQYCADTSNGGVFDQGDQVQLIVTQQHDARTSTVCKVVGRYHGRTRIRKGLGKAPCDMGWGGGLSFLEKLWDQVRLGTHCRVPPPSLLEVCDMA